jgi:hypothetical protein
MVLLVQLAQQVVMVQTEQQGLLAQLEALERKDRLAHLAQLEAQDRLGLLGRMETSVVLLSSMTGIPTLLTPTHRQVMSKQTTQRPISLLRYTLTIQTRMERTFNPS